MRAYEEVIKRASETVSRDLDFGPWLASLSATYVSHTITDAPGLAESATYSNGVVQVILAGGEEGGYYETTITMVASTGHVRSTTLGITNIGLASTGTPTGEIAVQDSLSGNATDQAPSVRAINSALSGKASLSDGITSIERSKLSGIAAGATVNAPDAQLRDRSTHTGTQPMSTVTGLTGEFVAVRAEIAAIPTAAPAFRGAVADEDGMLAAPVQNGGDWVTRYDTGTTWQLLQMPGNEPANWYELPYASGPVSPADIGLGNVNNTADSAKPVSVAQAAALALKADVNHSQAISTVTGLQAALDGKAAASHLHDVANVSGLQASLDAKAALTHLHTTAAVSGLDAALAAKQAALAAQHDGSAVAGAFTTINVVGGSVAIAGGVLTITVGELPPDPGEGGTYLPTSYFPSAYFA